MPGQTLAVPQLLTRPFRARRPSWTVSLSSKVPFTVAGDVVHVGTEKFNTEDPPFLNLTVRVKSIVVPQRNAGEVTTRKGVVFTAVAFSAVFGYFESRLGSHPWRGRGKPRLDLGAKQATIVQDAHVKFVALVRFDNPIAVTATLRKLRWSQRRTWPRHSDTHPRSWCSHS